MAAAAKHVAQEIEAAGLVRREAQHGNQARHDVRAQAETDAACAAMMFLWMSSDMAPNTMTCLDFDDIGLAPDAPGSQATLANAVWIRSEQKLLYASVRDSELVAQATSVAMLPLMSDLRIAEVHSICSVLRNDIRPGAEFLYAAPIDFDPFSALHQDFAAILMVCRALFESDEAAC